MTVKLAEAKSRHARREEAKVQRESDLDVAAELEVEHAQGRAEAAALDKSSAALREQREVLIAAAERHRRAGVDDGATSHCRELDAEVSFFDLPLHFVRILLTM